MVIFTEIVVVERTD